MPRIEDLTPWVPPQGPSRLLVFPDPLSHSFRREGGRIERHMFRVIVLADEVHPENIGEVRRWTTGPHVYGAILRASTDQVEIVGPLPYIDVGLYAHGHGADRRIDIAATLRASNALARTETRANTNNDDEPRGGLEPTDGEKDKAIIVPVVSIYGRRIRVDLSEPPSPPRVRTALTKEPPNVLPIPFEPAPKMRAKKRRSR